ncbi:TetR/AcrR family transcriptional regulator [Nonomuraea sp. NPDC050790]|uniref:TetR/AcrR family transcriptional regulator n=1 Tax=Nonomuraea sp. NPDC050790 TaxID=3364371 RepID=UPI0037B73FA3
MSPKRVDKAARRQEILDAAVRVFARKGFAASRIDDVAEEAGIGKGSVYLYFDSRDSLLEAAFSQYTADADAVLREALEGTGPPLERLSTLVRGILDVIAAAPDLARTLLDLWATDHMRPAYRAYRAAIAELIGQIRPGLGLPHATVIVGAIEGVVLQWLVDPEVPIADLADPVLEVLVEGLRERA